MKDSTRNAPSGTTRVRIISWLVLFARNVFMRVKVAVNGLEWTCKIYHFRNVRSIKRCWIIKYRLCTANRGDIVYLSHTYIHTYVLYIHTYIRFTEMIVARKEIDCDLLFLFFLSREDKCWIGQKVVAFSSNKCTAYVHFLLVCTSSWCIIS